MCSDKNMKNMYIKVMCTRKWRELMGILLILLGPTLIKITKNTAKSPKFHFKKSASLTTMTVVFFETEV